MPEERTDRIVFAISKDEIQRYPEGSEHPLVAGGTKAVSGKFKVIRVQEIAGTWHVIGEKIAK